MKTQPTSALPGFKPFRVWIACRPNGVRETIIQAPLASTCREQYQVIAERLTQSGLILAAESIQDWREE